MENVITVLRWVLGAPFVACGVYVVGHGWLLLLAWMWSRLRSPDKNLQSFVPLVGPGLMLIGWATWPVEHHWRFAWIAVAVDPATITLVRLIGTVVRVLLGGDDDTMAAADLDKLPPVAKDCSSPEGAILCLEDAYRRRDIEAAVGFKDFRTEAMMMLQRFEHLGPCPEEVVQRTAETLELAFRKEMSRAWPDCDGVQSYFTKREQYRDNIVAVTEVCRYPDGRFSSQRLLVADTPNGWRVLIPLSE
jgi:hypothetical protein